MPFTIETLFAFEGQGQGWSEAFYWSSATDDLSQAETLVTPLATARAQLLANTYVLTVGRNAVVRNNAGQPVLRQTDLFEPRLPGVASWAPNAPGVALMALWQTFNNLQSKKQYMRGIPAGIGDSGKAPDFTFGTFRTKWNSWVQAMQNFQAGWQATAVTSSATIIGYTVDDVTAQVTFTLSAPGFATWPVAFGLPTRVYCKLPGKSPLDGPLVVIPVSATACFTPGSHPVAPLPTGQIGVMQLRTPSLVTLAPGVPQGPPGIIHPQRIVTHKTGRPIYASRGRARTKVKW